MERDWERERGMRGCEIVCTWVWRQGRGSERVRYVMHY